jgi:hypothetical protein
MKKSILVILLIFLAGCAHMGTVKSHLNDKTFQAENLPYRDLSVYVISDGSWSKEDIQATVSNASNSMGEQVGIRLRLDGWIDHPLPSFSPTKGLQNIVGVMGKDHQKYDLVIGFSSRGVFYAP